MEIWNRIEQSFKRRFIAYLERKFARDVLLPQLLNIKHVRRILVIRQHDQLGDFLLATPVLRALRENFPEAHIGVVVREYFADVVLENPHIDERLVFKEHGTRWTVRDLRAFWRQLKKGWDMAIVLNTVSHSVTSDLLAHFSGAKFIVGSEHKIFPGCSRNFFYNLVAPFWEGERHQTERNLDIVRHIGVDTDDHSEFMQLTQDEKIEALQVLENAGLQIDAPVIGMHIGAGKVANRWPITYFRELADSLRQRYDAQIILFWGPKEKLLSQSFLEQASFKPILVPPGDLRNIAAHFSQCDVLVCNDTGVMHLAAAAHVPLLAIFGPTDPNEWKPIGDRFVALRDASQKTEDVSVEQVLHELQALVGEKMVQKEGADAPETHVQDVVEDLDVSDAELDSYISALETGKRNPREDAAAEREGSDD